MSDWYPRDGLGIDARVNKGPLLRRSLHDIISHLLLPLTIPQHSCSRFDLSFINASHSLPNHIKVFTKPYKPRQPVQSTGFAMWATAYPLEKGGFFVWLIVSVFIPFLRTGLMDNDGLKRDDGSHTLFNGRFYLKCLLRSSTALTSGFVESSGPSNPPQLSGFWTKRSWHQFADCWKISWIISLGRGLSL